MDKSLPTEAEEQKALVQWLNIKHILHFAPINENNHSKLNRQFSIRNEAKAKAMGKVAGVCDMVVFLEEKILFIELKRKKKLLKNGTYSTSHTSTSESQKKFIGNANRFDYVESKVCYGWEEAKEFIETYRQKVKNL